MTKQTDEYNYTLQGTIAEVKAGDKTAFFTLFQTCNDKIFYFVLRRTGSRDEALDIVQEVFIDVWKGMERFVYKNDEAFYGFIFLIAKRRVAKYYRSRKQTYELDENFVGENYDLPYEDYRFLEAMIVKLKPKAQEIIRMRYWDQLSFKEISVILNIGESAAKVRCHRAMKQLKVLSEEYAEV